jgi:sigma-B regulation protein RsbU (phosphoserine phosphatase)
VTLTLGLLFMARDTTRVFNWTSSGFTLCSIQQGRDSTVTFFSVEKADFTAPPYPARGDTILMIGDSAALEKRWVNALEMPHVPGREVLITFLHKGQVESSVIRTRANSPVLVATVVVMQVLRILIFLVFLALGFWAYLQRRDSAGVRALALYCFAMTTFTVTVFMPMYAAMASFTIPGEGWLAGVLRTVGVFFGAYWFLLQLLFPRPARLIVAHPWRTYGVIFVPLAILTAFTWVLAFVYPMTQVLWTRPAFYAIVTSQALAGLYVLRRNYRRAESNVEKRQTRLVLIGSGVPLLVFVVYLLDFYRIIPGLPRLPLVWRMTITDVIFAIVLLSPLSLAYAFGKYRLLEIEGKLRRGTRRILLLTVLFAAVLGIAYVGNQLIHRHFSEGSPIAVVVLSVVVIGMFRLAEMGKHVLEKHLYPERLRLRAMLHDFLQGTAAIADKRAFWSQLEARLEEGLTVDGVYPVLRGSTNGSFLLRETGPTPFHIDSSLVKQLIGDPRPLMVDEILSGSRVSLDVHEAAWLMQHRVALVLPLITHGNLIGFIGLGHKTEQEDYAAEELRILDSLAPQVALASDNMRLIEENIVKRRMEEELQMARRVQKGLLPKELPPTLGLDLAVHTDFSLEVAGDYYDVICFDDQRTLFAVGDVAGKGAGAALLMSNLQASLRALAGADLPLTQLIGRVNMLIYQNTEPEQFITFFVGIFDPRDQTLRYVNAGHNPPFLIRAGGGIDYLTAGGLILGAFDDSRYELGTARLAADDVLVLYTDGISEAMNAAEEEFGEERLSTAACACAPGSAEQILSEILGQIVVHRGQQTYIEDDQTLLVAKVI